MLYQAAQEAIFKQWQHETACVCFNQSCGVWWLTIHHTTCVLSVESHVTLVQMLMLQIPLANHPISVHEHVHTGTVSRLHSIKCKLCVRLNGTLGFSLFLSLSRSTKISTSLISHVTSKLLYKYQVVFVSRLSHQTGGSITSDHFQFKTCREKKWPLC